MPVVSAARPYCNWIGLAGDLESKQWVLIHPFTKIFYLIHPFTKIFYLLGFCALSVVDYCPHCNNIKKDSRTAQEIHLLVPYQYFQCLRNMRNLIYIMQNIGPRHRYRKHEDEHTKLIKQHIIPTSKNSEQLQLLGSFLADDPSDRLSAENTWLQTKFSCKCNLRFTDAQYFNITVRNSLPWYEHNKHVALSKTPISFFKVASAFAKKHTCRWVEGRRE